MHSHSALTSWKEIANYLGKGVRTVQRWEVEDGMPVRRPNAHNSGFVIALPQELDAWLESRSSRVPTVSAQESSKLQVQARVAADAASSLRLRSAIGRREVLEGVLLAHRQIAELLALCRETKGLVRVDRSRPQG